MLNPNNLYLQINPWAEAMKYYKIEENKFISFQLYWILSNWKPAIEASNNEKIEISKSILIKEIEDCPVVKLLNIKWQNILLDSHIYKVIEKIVKLWGETLFSCSAMAWYKLEKTLNNLIISKEWQLELLKKKKNLFVAFDWHLSSIPYLCIKNNKVWKEITELLTKKYKNLFSIKTSIIKEEYIDINWNTSSYEKKVNQFKESYFDFINWNSSKISNEVKFYLKQKIELDNQLIDALKDILNIKEDIYLENLDDLFK